MNHLNCVVAVAMFTLAAEGHAAPADMFVPTEGLVKVESRTCSEVYTRPGAVLGSYRQVVIDSGTVSFRVDWLRNTNGSRDPSRWITPNDEQQIAIDFRTWMRDALTTALRAHGYQVVPTAGPGTLELKPRLVDLYVNAPDKLSAGRQTTLTREAGETTLVLEVRDAAGTLLLQSVDHRTAMRSGLLSPATSVSNSYDFSSMFRQWAVGCAGDLVGG